MNSTKPGIVFDTVHTPYGVFQIAASDRGVVSINFPKHHELPQADQQISPQVRRILSDLKAFLKRYFSGRLGWKIHLPIDLDFFTPFEQEVLKALQKVKPGSLTTYGALARACGHPRASRAVGSTLRRNPIPILIPCHRVIRTDSSLGGYQIGRRWKKMLLSHEKGARGTLARRQRQLSRY